MVFIQIVFSLVWLIGSTIDFIVHFSFFYGCPNSYRFIYREKVISYMQCRIFNILKMDRDTRHGKSQISIVEVYLARIFWHALGCYALVTDLLYIYQKWILILFICNLVPVLWTLVIWRKLLDHSPFHFHLWKYQFETYSGISASLSTTILSASYGSIHSPPLLSAIIL